jgi:hypothetical protein
VSEEICSPVVLPITSGCVNGRDSGPRSLHSLTIGHSGRDAESSKNALEDAGGSLSYGFEKQCGKDCSVCTHLFLTGISFYHTKSLGNALYLVHIHYIPMFKNIRKRRQSGNPTMQQCVVQQESNQVAGWNI